MKKNFNKEFVMTKKDNEGFKNSTKCWICDHEYFDGDVKVRDSCHAKLNHKIPVVKFSFNLK